MKSDLDKFERLFGITQILHRKDEPCESFSEKKTKREKFRSNLHLKKCI